MPNILKKCCLALLLIATVAVNFAGCSVQGQEDGSLLQGMDGDGASGSFISPQVRKPTADELEKYPQITNVPTLYITLDDAPLSSVPRDSYIPAKYTLVYENGESGIYDEPLMIKGRGNYSWSFPQKPYTLKLAKETSILGMESGRKWILITTHSDKTLLRNYLTLNLALDTGLDTGPSCQYVDVCFNGEYNGTYLISEAVQIHPNRVNIDEETEALFEIEATYRHTDHTYCIEMRGGDHHITYKKPDANDIFPEVRLSNLEKFRDFFEKLDKSLDEGFSEYSKYIDTESFVNWYIVNEFVKNFDSGFTSSCYCYIKDGKLCMGPVWDYDTCYGNQEVATCINPNGYHVQTSPWYKALMKDETFFGLVSERWTELRDEGLFDDFVTQIDELVEYISDSQKINHELWPGALKSNALRGRRSRYTFEDEVDYLTDWILKRINWLDGEWYAKGTT